MQKIDDFKKKLNEIYPENGDKILNTHFIDKNKTFRINKLQSNEDVINSLVVKGFQVHKIVNFDGFFVDNSPNYLSDTDEFKTGKIYIQGLSSMVPVKILEPKVGEKILDLCAAPGSKTSQIASESNDKVELTAVEENKNRFFRLKDILKVQGVENVKCILEDGVRLSFKRPEFINYFDKVLLDAPCTSEAEIDLNDNESLKLWRTSNASKLSKLQKGLLNSAVKMVKPGGTIVYSTCTYSVEENEMVLNWILKRYPNLIIENIGLKLPNIVNGLTEWRGKSLNPQIKNSIRIIPNEHFNGFFVAKLVKPAI